jgi:hypothetical protein
MSKSDNIDPGAQGRIRHRTDAGGVMEGSLTMMHRAVKPSEWLPVLSTAQRSLTSLQGSSYTRR